MTETARWFANRSRGILTVHAAIAAMDVASATPDVGVDTFAPAGGDGGVVCGTPIADTFDQGSAVGGIGSERANAERTIGATSQ